MIIGTVNDNVVRYSEVNKTVKISNTNIILVGVNSKEDAIKRCEINFKNFKEV